jgi:ribonuclease P protein component
MLDPGDRTTSGEAEVRLRTGERIKRGAEYRRVYENATAIHGRALVVFIRREEALLRRAGFVAGRRVRRVLKESYRHLKSQLPPRGLELVFVARPPCALLKAGAVRQEMIDLLTRGGVFS